MGILEGKVAVVTGGGRGVGRAAALELARLGAAVTVADVDRDAAGAVMGEIVALGGRATWRDDDVSSFAGAEAVVAATTDAFGRVDVLVTCAGNFAVSNILELTEEEWDSITSVHVNGHAACIKAASARMVAQGEGGRIITIGSRGAFWSPGVAYSAAKAAVMGLTSAMSMSLRDHGITVNCVLPSARTDLFPATAPRTFGGMPASTDMDPASVAPVIAYLASPYAEEVTGRFWYSSGGDVALYDHPFKLQDSNLLVRKTGTWDVEELDEVLPPLIGTQGHRW